MFRRRRRSPVVLRDRREPQPPRRVPTTQLATGLVFEVVKVPGYPRGLRAYLHRGGDGNLYAVRPDAPSGLWRVDRLQGIFGPEGATWGYFDAPEHAARALEVCLELGREPHVGDALDLLAAELARAVAPLFRRFESLDLPVGGAVALRGTL